MNELLDVAGVLILISWKIRLVAIVRGVKK